MCQSSRQIFGQPTPSTGYSRGAIANSGIVPSRRRWFLEIVVADDDDDDEP